MAEPKEIEDATAAAAEEPAAEEPAEEAAAEPVKRSGGGRVLATLALLLAFAAAGIAGYAGWLAHQAAKPDAVATLEARLAAQEQRQRSQGNAAGALRAELEALATDIEQELAAVQEGLAQQQALIAEAAAASRGSEPARWRLAEVEYLMRVANHRLLMERDADGAENLLALADEVLAEVGALAYHEVRALLAEEIAALRAFEGVDSQGIFLRLEAIKGQLDALPLRLPAYSGPPSLEPDEKEAPSALDVLIERLGGLIRFRRHEGEAVRPLLPPEQVEYLQLNLRLALDRAQLAALRHDAEVHRASLAAARDWLHRFVDPSRQATQRLLQELDALLATDFGGELPNISRSLARLRAMRTEPDAA